MRAIFGVTPSQVVFIRGGRAHLQQALYMPALVAVRCNADMKQRYKAFIIAGKPKKAAIAAIMRKMVALALLRDQRNWNKKLLDQTDTLGSGPIRG